MIEEVDKFPMYGMLDAMTDHTFQLRIPRALSDAAKIKAVKVRKSLAQVVRELLAEWVEEPEDDR